MTTSGPDESALRCSGRRVLTSSGSTHRKPPSAPSPSPPPAIVVAASSRPMAPSTRLGTSARTPSRCRRRASSCASGPRSRASSLSRPDGGTDVTAVETDAGTIETERVIVTGGPSLRAVGRLAGVRIPVGAARHSVAVLEPHPAFETDRLPMVFDIGAGLYWRTEEGGLLFGWSAPDDVPGEARRIDWVLRRDARPTRRPRAGHRGPRPATDLG